MYYNYFPFGFNQRNRVRRIDHMGIPVMRTVAVTTNTSTPEVTYNLNACQFRELPNEGIILLHINHTPATGSLAFPVSIATTPLNSNSGTSSMSSSKVPLINGSGGRMLSREISQGNRYFIYYNKCNGVFQTVNHIIPPTTTAEESASNGDVE